MSRIELHAPMALTLAEPARPAIISSTAASQDQSRPSGFLEHCPEDVLGPRFARVSSQKLWRFGFPHLRSSSPLFRQHPAGAPAPPYPRASHYPKWPGHLTSFKVSSLLRSLLCRIRCCRLLHRPSPHTEELWVA